MIDRLMADLLAATYYHTVSAFRPQQDGTEITLCRDAPCAQSQRVRRIGPKRRAKPCRRGF